MSTYDSKTQSVTADYGMAEEGQQQQNDGLMKDSQQQQQLQLQQHRPAKRGHKFLGCGCDSKRAVIIMNVLTLIINVWAVTSIVFDRIKSRHELVDDDQVRHDIKHSKFIFIMSFIAFFGSVCGIFGAKYYNMYLVGIALLVNGMFLIRHLIDRDWLAILIFSIVVYPHAVFIHELEEGIMSPLTYEYEEHCF